MSRERRKTVLIGVLGVLLVALTAFNFIYGRGSKAALTDEPPRLDLTVSENARAKPVAVTLTLDGVPEHASYGDEETEQIYDAFRPLIAEAFGAARVGGSFGKAENEVYFTFAEPQYAWLFAESLGVPPSEALEERMFTSFSLSGEGTKLRLILYDEKGEGIPYSAPLPFAPNGMELPEAYPEPGRDSEFYGLERAAFRRDTTDLSPLLTAFGFNPNTDSRYTDASDALVVVDGARSLRITADGYVNYHNSEELLTAYANSDERNALRAAVRAVPHGAAFWGEGRLEVYHVERLDDGAYSVTLSYLWRGARLVGAESVVVVQNGGIIEARMKLMPVRLTDTLYQLLPERQAQLLAGGRRLSLNYREADGVFAPEWVAER
ncbi:hypothetical protein FACS18949_03650 [Clostridia bacterium]|nr:hypothetical protein FACS18949_03650 [Clostridia bacterium]